MPTRNKKNRPGQLRIVAGIWRSRLLQVANVPGLRPTSVRIRETLFNWLLPTINGSVCLDLFAGTGALGLEALSRGASRVVFVETSATAVGVLRSNIDVLETPLAQLVNTDARTFLQSATPEQFDIVFLDPPFAADLLDELCRLLTLHGWLAKDARIYIEMDKRKSEVALPAGWRILMDKVAGNVRYMLATIEK